MRISLNISMTADGKAGFPGEKRLMRIGSEADKIRMKRLREAADAVLAGSGTIRYDNTALGVNKENRRVGKSRLVYPLRIAVVGRWIPPPEAKIFDPVLGGTTVVACGRTSVNEIRKALPGIRTLECGNERKVDIRRLVKKLEEEWNIKELLVEGGPTINGLFLRENLVDRYYLTLCPYLFGGSPQKSVSPIAGTGVQSPESGRFKLTDLEKSDEWVFLTYDRY